MTVFGDYDPDDVWDASDPVDELLRVLAVRVVWLIDHRDDLPARVARIAADISVIRARVAMGAGDG